MSENMVDISGLDKASVVCVLFNNLGMPRTRWARIRLGSISMHISGGQAIMKKTGGKIGRLGWFRLNVDLSGDTFDMAEYDRTNQTGVRPLLRHPLPAAQMINLLRDLRRSDQEQLETENSCPIIPLPSTRFLQLRLLFGNWYYCGKSPYVQRIPVNPKSIPLPR